MFVIKAAPLFNGCLIIAVSSVAMAEPDPSTFDRTEIENEYEIVKEVWAAANSSFAKNELDQAHAGFTEAMDRTTELVNQGANEYFVDVARILYGRSQVLLKQGHMEESIADSGLAIALANEEKTNIGNGKLRAQVANDLNAHLFSLDRVELFARLYYLRGSTHLQQSSLGLADLDLKLSILCFRYLLSDQVKREAPNPEIIEMLADAFHQHGIAIASTRPHDAIFSFSRSIEFRAQLAEMTKRLEHVAKLALSYFCRADANDKIWKFSKAVNDRTAYIDILNRVMAEEEKHHIHDPNTAIRIGIGHIGRATTYLSQGNVTQALDDIGKCQLILSEMPLEHTVIPMFATANNQLARFFNRLALVTLNFDMRKNKNPTDAIKHAHKACSLTDWNVAFYLETLATAHADADDFAKAVEIQEKVVNLTNELARQEPQAVLDEYKKRLMDDRS